MLVLESLPWWRVLGGKTENWTFMTDLWWRGNVCHDVTNCHADVSRSVAVMCCDQGVGVTTKNGPISTDNHSQLAPNCKHFHSSFTLYTCCSPSFGERHFHTKYVITSSLRRADRLLSLPLLSAFLFASIHPPILPTEVQIMLLIIKC